MLTYKKKASIVNDSESMLKNQKKDPSTINITDINKIEQSVTDDNNQPDNNTKQNLNSVLNLDMNTDPNSMNFKTLDPTAAVPVNIPTTTTLNPNFKSGSN